jgi:hypothetical protein
VKEMAKCMCFILLLVLLLTGCAIVTTVGPDGRPVESVYFDPFAFLFWYPPAYGYHPYYPYYYEPRGYYPPPYPYGYRAR